LPLALFSGRVSRSGMTSSLKWTVIKGSKHVPSQSVALASGGEVLPRDIFRAHRLTTESSADVPPTQPHNIFRRPTGEIQRDLPLDALRAAFERPDGGTLWVDLDVSDDAQAALLTELFHFHPLAVEDARNPSSRVKAEEYPGFLVVVARVVSFCETTPDPYDLETANLTLFLSESAVVTTHMEALPAVQALVARLESNPDLLERGPARVAHHVLDTAIDAYFPILDQLDEFVDDMEQRVFGQFDERLLQEIFKVKRLVISLRRYLAPQREVLSMPRRSSISATCTTTCCGSPMGWTAIAT
jgi:magnesium transporter